MSAWEVSLFGTSRFLKFSMPSLRRRPTRATKPGATGRRVVIYYHRPCALLLMSPRLRRYVPRCCCWRRNFSASNNYEEEGDAQEGKEGATKLFCFSYLLLDNARYDQVIASSGLSVNALTTETMLTGQGVCFSEPIQGNEGKVATLLLTLCKRCTHFSAISAALCFLLSPHPYTWE